REAARILKREHLVQRRHRAHPGNLAQQLRLRVPLSTWPIHPPVHPPDRRGELIVSSSVSSPGNRSIGVVARTRFGNASVELGGTRVPSALAKPGTWFTSCVRVRTKRSRVWIRIRSRCACAPRCTIGFSSEGSTRPRRA